jgi:hypothetical protein
MLDKIKRMIAEGDNVVQLPGTKRLQKDDRVTHPDHPGVHLVYSTPPSPDSAALIYPEGHKFENDIAKDTTGMSGIKRVPARELTLLDK